MSCLLGLTVFEGWPLTGLNTVQTHQRLHKRNCVAHVELTDGGGGRHCPKKKMREVLNSQPNPDFSRENRRDC